MKAKFITSAAQLEGCPPEGLPEIGFIGRSNAGKSSLINALAKQKNLARVSQTPGKTDLLNFYEFDRKFMLVDTPGYGYAARGHQKREEWGPMIERYIEERTNLKGVVLVMDVSRSWSSDEARLVDWLAHFGRPVVLALNKVDKLNQKETVAKKREFDALKSVSHRVYVSANRGSGIDELLRTVFEKLIRT